jgi:N-terminal domain of NWD NACHT-NTPase
MNGLEVTAGLICRLYVVEDVYSKGSKSSLLDSSRGHSFKSKFEETLVSLYRTILEFQARAVLYLRKPLFLQTVNDMFRQDGWEKVLCDITSTEISLQKFTELINADELRARFQELQNKQDGYAHWNERTERDKRVAAFLNWLHTCPYR